MPQAEYDACCDVGAQCAATMAEATVLTIILKAKPATQKSMMQSAFDTVSQATKTFGRDVRKVMLPQIVSEGSQVALAASKG